MMSGMSGIEVWARFEHDPRVPANVDLRASDQDRQVIASVLGDAFSQGRLTHEEYDERSDAALTSRTLGDLLPLVQDLPVTRASRPSIADRAVQDYEADRRQALWAFFSASLVCWVIWFASGFGDGWNAQFPWPLFVMLGTGLNVGRVMWQKDDLIAEETRRLEKKERKALEKGKSTDD